ncbi:GATA zinc finger-domain-containing protein [Parasitella parasitica]|nr:GATA zinc finger-domain-containing protein [Parasitella parasitica]
MRIMKNTTMMTKMKMKMTNTLTISKKDHAEYELIRQARNLQNSSSQSRPKYRRRNRRNMIGQKCHSCGTTETPEWRRGPDGARTLCNACGLHYSKLLKKGSIGVQTQNYLITGGSPRVSTSSTVLQAQSIRNSSFNFKAIEVSPHTVNFPFVLMDPKYLDKRFGTMKQQTSVSAPKQQSFHTPSPPPQQQRQLPSLSSTLAANNESNFVNINPLQKLPLPSLNEANRNTTDNINSNTVNNSSNTINPLRIHQWKQTE